MSDWELEEAEAQRQLAVRLTVKGLPFSVVRARVDSIGAPVDERRLRRWMKGARDERGK